MKPSPSAPPSCYALLLSLVMIVSSPVAMAQWSTDPLVNNPICTAAGNQRIPATISDGAGGAITTWVDARNGNLDIYAQRINAAGVVEWTTNGVAISTAVLGQENPVLTSDGAGGAIIAWQDNRPGLANYDIYARRITATGAVQWAGDGAPVCVLAGIQGKPQIVGDGAGGAVITWEDGRGTNYDIYAQRIDASGAALWPANGVAVCAAVAAQRRPMMAANGAAGAIITWYDQRGGDNDIYAQLVNASGVVQWTTNGVAVSTATSFQMNPALASDGSGGAIITWQDFRNGADYDIYVQRINAAGAVQWLPDGIAACVATGAQEGAVVVSDDAGGAFITWTNGAWGSTTQDIYAQRIDASGVGQWDIDGTLVTGAVNSQDVPSIARDGAGGVIIAWQDRRLGNNEYYNDIFAQRFDALGTAQWAANGLVVSRAVDSQAVPTLVDDGSGGAIIVWEDHRVNPTWDIYAGRIPADGTSPLQLTGLTGTIIGTGVVRLNWSTSSEINNWYFEVQRRLVGAPLFETLPGSFVSGSGTTTATHTYAFDDSLVTQGQWQYRIRQTDFDFTIHYSGPILIDMVISGVQDAIPRGPALSQNCPNPFNPSTAIGYFLPARTRVTLQVFDVRGRVVATLINGVEESGDRSVQWDAAGMASGEYFYRLQAGDMTLTRKLLLVR